MARPQSTRQTERITITVDSSFKSLIDEFSRTTGLSGSSFVSNYLYSSEHVLKSVIASVRAGNYQDKEKVSELLSTLIPLAISSPMAQKTLSSYADKIAIKKLRRTTAV